MILNSLTGRRFPFIRYHPNKEGFEIPDSNLTIAVIIICIVGPFWLLFKFAKQITGKTLVLTPN